MLLIKRPFSIGWWRTLTFVGVSLGLTVRYLILFTKIKCKMGWIVYYRNDWNHYNHTIVEYHHGRHNSSQDIL